MSNDLPVSMFTDKGVGIFINLFICWSSSMPALLLNYHSIFPCTSKGDISAKNYLSFLEVILAYWSIDKPK